VTRALSAPIAAPVESGRLELVRRAAGGDEIAFERVVASQLDRSFRTARAILGNDADARDAVQEAFVSAWRELGKLREAGNFDAWLQRIVVNACRAELRRRARVREITLDPQFDPRGRGPAVSDQVEDTELLGNAFERLDGDKRSILVLHYLHHEPIASIAAALGIPAGTVKWRLSEARAALARALAAEGEARR
jgi:RNA polymerase sigma-70 factor (ECF subfamily)